MDKKHYRAVMGERLRAFRLSQGLTAYKVAKDGGIAIGQVNAIENGNANYTIDVFLGYIRGSNLYLFFGEKEKEKSEASPIDTPDMIRSAEANDPRL